MPKEYASEVKLFALQKKREGHTWEEVRDLIKQKFALDSVPSRRQMTKWVSNISVPGLVIDRVGRGLPDYITQMLSQQQDAFVKIMNEAMGGKDFNVLILKWMLSQMKDEFGIEKLKAAWTEFEEEESNPGSDRKSGINDGRQES